MISRSQRNPVFCNLSTNVPMGNYSLQDGQGCLTSPLILLLYKD